MGKIIDVSKHQGEVDWSKAKSEVDLAIIRVQYGSTTVDSKYKEYVAECKKYGIPFGHYAYARFVSVNDARVEAKDFLARAHKDAKFLVVDVEEVTTKNKADLVPATNAFIAYLKENSDKKVGLYTGHSFWTEQGMDKVKGYDFLWIPRYSTKKPTMPCDLWQYTDKGKVAGFSGNVDTNKLNGNKDLAWFVGSTVQAVKVTKPIAKPTAKPKEKYVLVTASVLNVRAGAGTNYAVLGQIKKGQKYKYGTTVGDWINIYYGAHGGWVHKAYVKFV